MEIERQPNEILQSLKAKGICSTQGGAFKISDARWKELDSETRMDINYMVHEWDYTVID